MSQTFSYITIKGRSESLFKDRGSKFYGYIFPVINEIDIKNRLQEIQTLHPKARHHCYAYRLGVNNEVEKANDDGEPNGSAGLPILNQLKSHNTSNILAIVVRYFGGTKLGVSGLINAYKMATKSAFENTELIEKELFQVFNISTEYIHANHVYTLIEKFEGKLLDQSYDDKSVFKIRIPLRLKEQFEIVAKAIRVIEIQYE